MRVFLASETSQASFVHCHEIAITTSMPLDRVSPGTLVPLFPIVLSKRL